MRHQSKFNVKERELNEEEKDILAEVEKTNGLNIHAKQVRYERHTPRATVCTIFCAPWWSPLWTDILTGVTMRSHNDVENPEIGQLWSFRRALEDHIEAKRSEWKTAISASGW